MSITITDKAARQVAALLREQNAADKALRLFVKAGGCSGFEYAMSIDEPKPDDEVVAACGARVVVDPKSLGHLRGSIMDYVEGLQGTGFKISNPNAKETCGCGKSFG